MSLPTWIDEHDCNYGGACALTYPELDRLAADFREVQIRAVVAMQWCILITLLWNEAIDTPATDGNAYDEAIDRLTLHFARLPSPEEIVDGVATLKRWPPRETA